MKGHRIYEEMRKISQYMRRTLVIYDFATALFWISLYEENLIFFFISAPSAGTTTPRSERLRGISLYLFLQPTKSLAPTRGLQGDVVYLSWPIAPLVYERGGGCGVSASENSCAHHVTWSPNKLWGSNYIFNLWRQRLCWMELNWGPVGWTNFRLRPMIYPNGYLMYSVHLRQDDKKSFGDRWSTTGESGNRPCYRYMSFVAGISKVSE